MKKTTQLLLFILLAYPLSIAAQKVVKDGTSMADLQLNLRNMMALRARFPTVAASRAVSFVPVCFHLVAKDDGTGRVEEARVLDLLCKWNGDYQRNGVDIQFYIKDNFKYINKTILYTKTRSTGSDSLLQKQKCSDALNIFITNTIEGNEPLEMPWSKYVNRISNTAAPYSADWILLSSNGLENTNVATYISAVYFGLVPTYFGSECYYAVIDSVCAPDSVTCDGTIKVALERVARTGARANCSQAGDGFCDTPADYVTASFVASAPIVNCAYAGKLKDVDCERLILPINNIMGFLYSGGCSAQVFTTEQKNAMRNNYLNLPQRAYIRSTNTPSLIEVTTPTQLTPAMGATTPYFNTVNLDWEDINGVLGYSVEVSRLSSFVASTATFKFVTKTSNFTLNVSNTSPNFFQQSGKYYWRVRPFGNYKTCGSATSEIRNFTTGTLIATKEIEGISDISLSPNPLSKTAILSLKMTNPTPFEGTIKVLDVAGKLLQSEKKLFKSGELIEQINVDKLNNGLFILMIETEKGTINKRFIVQN
jgi:hypothetical protein